MIVKDRYELVERIAVGGMGAVWRARDLTLGGRAVAIKLLREHHDLLDPAESRQRFQREVEALVRLKHPNIVNVSDHGDHDGQPFIAMEFIHGETLASIIRRRRPLSLDECLKAVEELCQGLKHAHRAGVVHRDIKPSNLIIEASTGTLKIVDFGLAKTGEASISRDGTLVGSLNYMSPEQMGGSSRVDHRSDVFSVGSVFYELLSYQKAFPGDLDNGLFTRITVEDPESLNAVRPDLPADVCQVVSKALQKRPANRYQDLSTMAREIGQIRERIAVLPSQDPTIAVSTRDAGILEQRLEVARRRLEGGALAEAAELAAGVLKEDPTSETALELQAEIARAERDRLRLAGRTEVPGRGRRLRALSVMAASAAALAVAGTLSLWRTEQLAVPSMGDIELVPASIAIDAALQAGAPETEPPTQPEPTVGSSADAVEPGTLPDGVLMIDALPWAQVVDVRDSQGRTFSGGEYTPVALTLPAGEYTVTLRREGMSRTEPVAVDGGRAASMRVEFESVDIEDYFQRNTPP